MQNVMLGVSRQQCLSGRNEWRVESQSQGIHADAREWPRTCVSFAANESAGCHSPKVDDFELWHAGQNGRQVARLCDASSDKTQSGAPGQAGKRREVGQEVVVEVEHANVRHHGREIVRKRRELTHRELEVDEVEELFRRERARQRVPRQVEPLDVAKMGHAQSAGSRMRIRQRNLHET